MTLPLTVRVMFSAVRAGIFATILFLAVWLGLVPATPAERTALSAPVGQQFPDGLRQMRAAQIVLWLAPDRAYALAGSASDPQVPGFVVKLIVQQAAAGNVARAPDQSQTPDTSRPDIDGPRFITAD